MKIRKWTALLLALAMVLALAGCGKTAKTFTADKLSVWIWESDQLEAWQAIADEWTEKTRIPVEVTAKDKASYWRDVEKGMLPDLFWMDSRHFNAYVHDGRLIRMDDHLSGSSLNLKGYYPQVVESYQVEGYTYGIPKDSSVMALWYNKALFDSMKVAYPEESWTWEDLAEAAFRLTNRHTGKYGMAINVDDTTNGWYNLVYSYGGYILDIDKQGDLVCGWNDANTVAAMELLAKIICDSMPSQSTMAALDGKELFSTGNCAMLIQSSDEAMGLIKAAGAENWACTVLPYCDLDGSGDCSAGERATLMDGNGWVISSRSDDPVAAFDLLEEFCSEESQKKLAEGSIAQPALTSLADDWVKSVEGWDFTPYSTMLNDAQLITAPVQQGGEDWLDHALSETLYIAWNDPARMGEMLQRQQSYTLSQLKLTASEEEAPADQAAAADEPAQQQAEEGQQETPDTPDEGQTED
ncbi:MAG: sugar ABC transporter substrate-binding protein [Oscillospiraceae bacterium]|nr:sugar ABC transporter substrate-binding protein [Oscillospiraceae bacterium]